MKLTYELNEESLQDLVNLCTGLFHPLTGFMNSADYRSVVDSLVLVNGEPFSLPITLDVEEKNYSLAKNADDITLCYKGQEVGTMAVEDCFEVDPVADVQKVYKTADPKHPGVKKELGRYRFRIGGKTQLKNDRLCEGSMRPDRLKDLFKKNGWKTVVGFQTRNPIHRAHEHLQRIGLELCDGLFINPIVGWKKRGDFSEAAVMRSYEVMLDDVYPRSRVHLQGLATPMRYAGPREAIFHAIIRRNVGCTHFIIGRDHAGVGSYYGTYEAHELATGVARTGKLGIALLLLKEPYYCCDCEEIVSENTCGHKEKSKIEISGTLIRQAFSQGRLPDPRMMRPQIAKAILTLGSDVFITEGD
jgi:sulfate adenylyltransferase